MTTIDRVFVRLDRYSDTTLVFGLVAVTTAFWTGFALGALVILRGVWP